MKTHHSLNKMHSPSNPSPEFISYLKNTSDLSRKENHYPNHPPKSNPPMDSKPSEKKDQLSKSKIVEGDFNAIACSYILEGNMLRRQEAFEDAIGKPFGDTMGKQKSKGGPHEQARQKENAGKKGQQIDRKEVLKLEYLEKMGYLTAEEKQTLTHYRKTHPKEDKSPVYPAHKLPDNRDYRPQHHDNILTPQSRNPQPNHPEDLSNYHQQSFYSPKYTANQGKEANYFSSMKMGSGQSYHGYGGSYSGHSHHHGHLY